MILADKPIQPRNLGAELLPIGHLERSEEMGEFFVLGSHAFLSGFGGSLDAQVGSSSHFRILHGAWASGHLPSAYVAGR
jgi:hypothetical protein